ncbi:MAG: hypothetical protein EXS12_05190 [Phycisphaerales bacterium]|nr:hypothetical protein [Phycisphaerales bacterium]
MTTAQTDILKQLDDPEPGSTWFWSLASIVVFVVIMVAASAFYFKIDSFEVDAKIIDQPTLSLEQLRATQREELAVYSTYSWILPDGKSATFTRIPIDRAIEMVIQDAKSAPRTLPASSAPVAAPIQPAATSTAQPGAKK